MTQRIDTILRAAIVVAGIAALAVSVATADNDTLTRTERFGWLVALAFVILLAAGVGFDIIERYEKRRPLRLRWGKPRTQLGGATAPPDRDTPSESVVTGRLRLAPVLAWMAGSIVAAVAAGIVGYALARTATADGGTVVYLLLALAIWMAVRSLIRVIAGARALRIDADRARLGWALGYWPPLDIERADVDAFESRDGFLAFVTAGRRFELDTQWFADPRLANKIAGMWPEVSWREIPRSAIPRRLPWWNRPAPTRHEDTARTGDLGRRN